VDLVAMALARRTAEEDFRRPEPGADFRFCKCGCGRRINLKLDGTPGRPNTTGYSGYCPEFKAAWAREKRRKTRGSRSITPA
jgi:hypothetical protein